MPRCYHNPEPWGRDRSAAYVSVSEATAQMFAPDDTDRPVKAFLQEYQTLFGFGPEAITNPVLINFLEEYILFCQTDPQIHSK